MEEQTINGVKIQKVDEYWMTEDAQALQNGALALSESDYSEGAAVIDRLMNWPDVSSCSPHISCGLRAAMAAREIAKTRGLDNIHVMTSGLGHGYVSRGT